jgi:hypothetical protein
MKALAVVMLVCALLQVFQSSQVSQSSEDLYGESNSLPQPVLAEEPDLGHPNDIPSSHKSQRSQSRLIPVRPRVAAVAPAIDPSSSLIAKTQEQIQASVVETETPSTVSRNSNTNNSTESLMEMSIPYGYISNNGIDKNSPVRDPLCGGCRIAVIQMSKKPTCWSEIKKRMAEQKQMNVNMNISTSISTSLVDAAIMVAKKYPSFCARCHPDACSETDKMYWRIDQGAPRVNKGWTHRVDSIPSKHRIPESFMGDLGGFFSNSSNNVKKRQYYYEYNPSIVVLPADQVPDIPGESAVYLASYRITEAEMCMTDDVKGLANPDNHSLPEDYLAIGFLREDLTKIQDFVIDLRKSNFRVHDFRLFTLKDQLYLTGTNLITPIWVNLPKDLPYDLKKKDIKVLRDMFKKDHSAPSLSVRNFASCCTSKTCNGKNFNYFVGANDTILAEANPIFPHTVEGLDMKMHCRVAQSAAKVQGNEDTSISTSTGPEYPSFHSNMERNFAVRGGVIDRSSHRGTACCGKIQVPDEKSGKLKNLLVGVSHQKYVNRKWRKNPVKNYSDKAYLSALYAFEAEPPYRIVARSGAFCFGYPDKEEAKENYYANMTLARTLLMGEPENCPLITFVSGITEKAGDPSKVIIGYGINDCISRFVEVDKSELVRLLFHPTGKFSGTAPLHRASRTGF